MLVSESDAQHKGVVQPQSTLHEHHIGVTIGDKTYVIPKGLWWRSEEEAERDKRRREARAALRRQRGHKKCSPALRKRVIRAFNCTCQYCGHKSDETDPFLHVDRIVPGSEGGNYEPDNITLACIRCNVNRHGIIEPAYGPVRPLSVVEGRP